MKSGRLRQRAELQVATKTADAAGTLIETWSTVAVVFVDIRPVRAREYVQQGQVQSDITHTMQIRYYDGLTAEHRLKVGDRIFNIAAAPINVDERNRVHEFPAIEAM